MVKHIVCAKLKDPTTENIAAMKALMLSMKAEIPFIKDMVVYEDFLHAPVSFDLMAVTDFETKDDLNGYVEHPYHAVYIQEESAKYVSEIRLVDYEI